jgi:hypothetical protein
MQHRLDQQSKKKIPRAPRSHKDGDRLVSGVSLARPPSLAWAPGPGACLASGARHRALVRSDRYSAESVWLLAPAPAQEVLAQFKLVKKEKCKNQGDVNSLCCSQFKNKRNHTSTSSRPAAACVWVFLRRDTVSLPYVYRGRVFAAATRFRSVSLPQCPHSVTSAYFESFSYSLSTTSC